MEGLQDVVDDIADRLGRPVTVDDRRGRLLAHSSHPDDTDVVRMSSILSRRTPEQLVDLSRAHGVDRSEDPTYFPGVPELRLHARLIVPLRCHGLVLGYLTVVDANRTIDDRDLRAYVQTGAAAAAILYRERLLRAGERTREHVLVRDVLFGDRETRERVEAQLVAEGMLTGSPVAAIVIRWRRPPQDHAHDTDVAVRLALARARRMLPDGSAVELVGPNQAVLLVHPTRVKDVRECARQVAALVSDGSEGAVEGIVAGFGDEVPSAAQGGVSYDQAVRAIQVAARVPGLPSPVGWCDLGVDRILSLLAADAELIAQIPPGCRELIRHPELLHTVERYLELGCEIKPTAEELSLHRTSLYARLEKAERITGLRFKSGEDRLQLHLSLRLLRLA